jgi:prevent-host-death family protein
MNTIRVSATAARNRFFELLDKVAAGAEVIIEKDRKEVAVMGPKKSKSNLEAVRKASERVHGLLKEYTVEEIAPTRKKGAWGNFGQWDDDGFMLSDKSSDKKKNK